MSQQFRAERPTVLSDRIQKAIASYEPHPVGPTLDQHVADELIAWLTSPSSIARSGGDGPRPFVFMAGDGKGSHVSGKRETRGAAQGAVQSSGALEGAKRNFSYTWPGESVINASGIGLAVGKIDKGMALLIDGFGNWQLDVLLEVYAPIDFWMDLSGFRETGGWPLFHLLIPPNSYAATAPGVGYPLRFTGIDTTLPGILEQVGFCTRYGQGQLVAR